MRRHYSLQSEHTHQISEYSGHVQSYASEIYIYDTHFWNDYWLSVSY